MAESKVAVFGAIAANVAIAVMKFTGAAAGGTIPVVNPPSTVTGAPIACEFTNDVASVAPVASMLLSIVIVCVADVIAEM